MRVQWVVPAPGEPFQGSGRCPQVKGQCGGSSSCPGHSSQGCFGLRVQPPPALQSTQTLGHSCVTECQSWSLPRSTSVRWIQATSWPPAWPEPSLSSLDGASLGAHCEAARRFSPPAEWAPVTCFPWNTHALSSVHGTHKPILGVLMSHLVVTVAVRWPRRAWEAPPQCRCPLTPRRGSAETGDALLVVTISPATPIPCGTEFVTTGALVQDEVTLCSHRAVLQQDKGLCQNHPEIRDHKSQVETQHPGWRLHFLRFPVVPCCCWGPWGHPGVPSCPGLAAICHQPAQQRFSKGPPDSWQAPRPH